jgi:hypothetical protein
VDMPISVISVLQVFFATKSLFLRYRPESTWRPKHAEFKVILLTVPESRNLHLNKDGGSASDDYQSQMLNIKRLRILYLAVLLLVQVNSRSK